MKRSSLGSLTLQQAVLLLEAHAALLEVLLLSHPVTFQETSLSLPESQLSGFILITLQMVLFLFKGKREGERPLHE